MFVFEIEMAKEEEDFSIAKNNSVPFYDLKPPPLFHESGAFLFMANLSGTASINRMETIILPENFPTAIVWSPRFASLVRGLPEKTTLLPELEVLPAGAEDVEDDAVLMGKAAVGLVACEDYCVARLEMDRVVSGAKLEFP